MAKEKYDPISSIRQAEQDYIRGIFKSHPNVRTFLIYDPRTRQPYPNQVLFSDVEKKIKEGYKRLPEVPEGYKYYVPDGIPQQVLSYLYTPEPDEEQAFQILLVLEKHVTKESTQVACSLHQQLLPDKPLDGVYAFIWRLARYLSGWDDRIPSTAFIDLIEGITSLTKLRVNPGRVTTITQYLQIRAEELVEYTGGNKYAAVVKWAKTQGVS